MPRRKEPIPKELCTKIVVVHSSKVIDSINHEIDRLIKETVEKVEIEEEKKRKIEELEKVRYIATITALEVQKYIIHTVCGTATSERTIIARYDTEFVKAVLEKLIPEKLDVRPIVKLFTEEILAVGLDVDVIVTYADKYPEVVLDFIRYRAEIEDIPEPYVEYIIELSKENAKNPIEFVAYLIGQYFYLLLYRELPEDFIDNLGYYLMRLPEYFFMQVLMRLPIYKLVETIYQSLTATLPVLVTFLVEIDDRENLNRLYQLAVLDKYHKQFLDTIYDYALISEDLYATFITYDEYVRSIILDHTLYSYAREYTIRIIKKEADRILEGFVYRIKEAIPESLKPLITMYALCMNNLLFVKSAVEQLILLFERLKPVYTYAIIEIIGFKPTITTKKLPKNVYPFPMLEYTISTMYRRLPRTVNAILGFVG